jgi:ABC-type transport system substrate-binding protein
MNATTLSRREFAAAGLVLAAGLAVGACGAPSAASARTLRIGQYWPPVSLDPAKIGGESLSYVEPAYDPLIYRAANGDYRPRLATGWRYVGTGNQLFELTLRPGVTFADGTPLTAAGLRSDIEYFRSAAGQAAALLASVSEVDVVDERTVRLRLAEPNPLLPTVFTQDYFAGNVISPAGIAAPARLATQTFGAGPYTLAPGQTVADDHYTYVRNPKYWNPRDVHYDQITIKVLPNENTALDALRTAQVDIIAGSYQIADEAKAAGMGLAATPGIVVGIQLNDRGGTLCPPLADQRVRQALNYAVDRVKITKALLGGYGTPTEAPAAPGQDGYPTANFYRFDPARARALLADAGYGNGFTLPVLIPSTPAFPGDMVAAIGSDLAKIGVTLHIIAEQPAAAANDATKFPATSMGWGVLPVYFMGRGLWLRDAIGLNPFHSSDPVLESLDQQAAAADPATRAVLDRQIIERVVRLGWFLPVCLEPQFLFYRNTLAVGALPGQAPPSVVAWAPAT